MLVPWRSVSEVRRAQLQQEERLRLIEKERDDERAALSRHLQAVHDEVLWLGERLLPHQPDVAGGSGAPAQMPHPLERLSTSRLSHMSSGDDVRSSTSDGSYGPRRRFHAAPGGRVAAGPPRTLGRAPTRELSRAGGSGALSGANAWG